MGMVKNSKLSTIIFRRLALLALLVITFSSTNAHDGNTAATKAVRSDAPVGAYQAIMIGLAAVYFSILYIRSLKRRRNSSFSSPEDN